MNEGIKVHGTVIETCHDCYRVQLDDKPDCIVMATVSGKLRKFKIRVLVGDEVTVELSPYDLTKGRITVRDK